jgi:hypothetical protein
MALSGKRTTYNVTMTNADTEYSQDLPDGTKKFLVKCRGLYDIKLANVESESGTKYITISAGMIYWEDEVNCTLTLYFQCATAGQICEIVTWQ